MDNIILMCSEGTRLGGCNRMISSRLTVAYCLGDSEGWYHLEVTRLRGCNWRFYQAWWWRFVWEIQMEVSYEHAGEIWFGCLKVVQFEILREVMVGFYWSICEIGGGRRRCRGRGGGGNCRFCRASPQHLRDVISPHSETTEVNFYHSCNSSVFIT